MKSSIHSYQFQGYYFLFYENYFILKDRRYTIYNFSYKIKIRIDKIRG